MAFENFVPSNNAQGQLIAGISAGAGTMILQTGQGGRFPSTFPYLCEIKQVDTVAPFAVLKREIVRVTGRTGDTLTIVRSAGTCLPNDTSNTPGTTAFSFSTGDTVTLTVTAETIKDIQDELVTKLPTAGGLRTGFGANRHVRVNRSTGAEESIAVSTGASVASNDIVRLEKASGLYEDIPFSILNSALAPQGLAYTPSSLAFDNLAENEALFEYNATQSTDTLDNYLNVGDISGNNIVTITRRLSSGVTGNTITIRTNKISSVANLGIRIVTCDAGGNPTTTLVNANAEAYLAQASVATGGATTTFTFPGSFSCGTRGTMVAVQVCQGTFASPTINAGQYYQVGFGVGVGVNTANLNTTYTWTGGIVSNPGVVSLDWSLKSARRIRVIGFNTGVTFPIGCVLTVRVGLRTFTHTFTSAVSNFNLPFPITIEKDQSIRFITSAHNFGTCRSAGSATTVANADITQTWGAGGSSPETLTMITSSNFDACLTSSLLETTDIREADGGCNLGSNIIGLSGGTVNRGGSVQAVTGMKSGFTGLTRGPYFLAGQGLLTQSTFGFVYVGSQLSSNVLEMNRDIKLRVSSSPFQYNPPNTDDSGPTFFQGGTLRYSIVTAAGQTTSIQWSPDIRVPTWTDLQTIPASNTVDRICYLPRGYIRLVFTGGIGTTRDLFY